jgi:hypothetical protein
LQVVDELAVLSVLAREDLLEFEDGRIDRDTTVELEDVSDLAEDLLAKVHVARVPVLRSLLAANEPHNLVSASGRS